MSQDKREWSSDLSTVTWGADVEGSHEMLDVLGNPFTPTFVEWSWYRLREYESTGNKLEEYIILHVCDDGHAMTFDPSLAEVPEWVPHPPADWTSRFTELVKLS